MTTFLRLDFERSAPEFRARTSSALYEAASGKCSQQYSDKAIGCSLHPLEAHVFIKVYPSSHEFLGIDGPPTRPYLEVEMRLHVCVSGIARLSDEPDQLASPYLLAGVNTLLGKMSVHSL